MKDGLMLSSVELAREWISNRGKDVNSFVGVEHRKVDAPRRKNLGGRHDAAGYFWNKRVWTWDPFRTFGSTAPDFEWLVHEGENALSVRTRNGHQMLGKPANVRVVLQKGSRGDEGRLP